ncbi:phage tail protein [Anaeromicropila populeti]|uniref:Phage Tail Collar Domain n=1 Tax=Anaeromicropila populeti TaxID=37658 RepID=A0A1I6J8R5_9FIRM|nr:tail fiber protein [Anaeromicropila populeti]SFR75356.1 Phage Tail Collar Domain [Anaeromicropila populeti]
MDEPFLGEIELFPYGFAPRGWLLCNGALLAVTSNQALYSLIGNKYGGSAVTTFAVPNLLGAEPVPYMNYYIAITGLYPQRS